MIAAALIGGFLAGTLAGWLFREAYEVARGEDDPLDLWRRLKKSQVQLLTLGLIVSMLFTGLVGVALIFSNEARGDLVRCTADYNKRVAVARDTRVAAEVVTSKAQRNYFVEDLRYQRGLIRVLESEAGLESILMTIRQRASATKRFIDEQDELTAVRRAEPYPSPDQCGGSDD